MAESSTEKKEGKKDGKKFEVKKWNAVALWAWGTRVFERGASTAFVECRSLDLR